MYMLQYGNITNRNSSLNISGPSSYSQKDPIVPNMICTRTQTDLDQRSSLEALALMGKSDDSTSHPVCSMFSSPSLPSNTLNTCTSEITKADLPCFIMKGILTVSRNGTDTISSKMKPSCVAFSIKVPCRKQIKIPK